jgi:ferredoxin
MRITVDRSRCATLGMCEEIAPDYFEVTDEGSMRLVVEDVSPADEDRIYDAVSRCPMQALSLD